MLVDEGSLLLLREPMTKRPLTPGLISKAPQGERCCPKCHVRLADPTAGCNACNPHINPPWTEREPPWPLAPIILTAVIGAAFLIIFCHLAAHVWRDSVKELAKE